MRAVVSCLLTIAMLVSIQPAMARAKKDKPSEEEKSVLTSGTLSGLAFRCIGPSFASGRIADIAVNPADPSEYYLGVAAGNVWKTTNSGVTWTPIFDREGAWSIADVELDPRNPHVVWVGTGEYNSQRAIGYGDGVYRSRDGGKSWKNMGLNKSEHIGRIAIDPRNSHIYVAAQGPLWGAGGERGLYKSTDEGETWEKILSVDENTGITDVVIDPRDPDTLYAAAYQRRRHVFTLINGGPGSAIHKSTDAGKTWRKLRSGLPGSEMGRIGLALSPVNPDYVYAIIEAQGKSGGVYRSTDRGESWSKRSSHVSGSPQYYNRIYCDPCDTDTLYSMDTIGKVSHDGGTTWQAIGNRHRHVDDHALWVDPGDTRHLIIGCDGGVYETFDSGSNWDFKENLPITQYYRVSVDNSLPFYYVYGGTQDNNSMGGPSRTTGNRGIGNDSWFVTNGGDGFESQVDPRDTNIVYAQSQYGGLVRYDRQSGESIDIKPQPPLGEAYRWNWNAPLIISPHNPARVYFAANKLFRSEDHGNTWDIISPDLTRQIDRNTLPVMGKIQSVDAVAKNASTSFFGTIVALDESPLVEGLLYAGTDDGLIQISEDGGENWQTIENVGNLPKLSYVDFLLASQHDANTVYAAFDLRKNNDLKPYLFKSTDRGNTWVSLAENLPDSGTVYCIAEDHVKPGLLFVGTEFGLFVTVNGGKDWIRMKAGLPTTQVRDIAIQKRENDLVLATFGRSFYILDDYTPLRHVSTESLKSEFTIFPVKDALMFMNSRNKSNMGETPYFAENPPVGAVITYYLKDSPVTRKQARVKAEKEAVKENKEIDYPDWESLRLEDNEESPYLLFTIRDEAGTPIRRLKGRASSGIHRIVWDFSYPDPSPVRSSDRGGPNEDSGMFVLPGTYTVSAARVVDGDIEPLAGEQAILVVPLNNTTLPAVDREALVAYQQQVAELYKAVRGTTSFISDLEDRLQKVRKAAYRTPTLPDEVMVTLRNLKTDLEAVERELTGDATISRRNENQPPSISSRTGRLVYGMYRSTSAPTTTMKTQLKLAGEAFTATLAKLRKLAEQDLPAIEAQLESHGAPWTPGRLPAWPVN